MLRILRKLINLPSYIRRLFTRTHQDPETVVSERWSADWRRAKSRRFGPEETDTYAAEIDEQGLVLTAKRPNLFAWTDDPWYRYRDFVLTADLSFEEPQGHAAVGLLFRKSDDSSFYDLLFSSEGRYRFDAVFNGNQIPLIPWTECPDVPSAGTFHIRVVARGTHFSFFVEEEWTGEMVDDTIPSGKLAFALQNYDQADSARVRLVQFTVESRPVEVEAAWYRWTSLVPAEPDRRVTLARTFMAAGQFQAAGVQLLRAAEARQLTADEHLLLAACRLNTGDPESALEAIAAALEREPGYVDALVEKANILYLQNRFLDLKEFLTDHLDRLKHLPGMWNLLGNCRYALGDRDSAVEAYREAVSIQDDLALFHINLGRTHELRGDHDEAIEAYRRASRLLFEEESYEELERVLARMSALDPEHPAIVALTAKIAFHDGNLEKARRLFESIVADGTDDSTVYFLLGILEARSGNRRRANELFATALELDDSAAVYWLRYAENRFIMGLDPEEPLQRALEIDPDEPWANNLAGLIALDAGREQEAVERFRKALEHAQGEPEIVSNLAEALHRSGNGREAYGLLESMSDEPACADELGRLYMADGRPERSIAEFTRAVELSDGDPDYRENLAAAYVETDQVLQAEEILSTLLESDPTAARYTLMAHAARAKGEFRRAESAYLEAMKLAPDSDLYARNLAEHYVSTGNYAAAEEIMTRRLTDANDERTARLRSRVHEETHATIRCASCGRTWEVPKSVGPQGKLRLFGEPPGDSPAGRCPTCGNIYCVSCAKEHVSDGRFLCAECGEPLKLNDDRLKYLVYSYVE